MADGVVPAARFCTTTTARTGGAASPSDVCAALPPGRRERFFFFRGVQWAAPDIDSSKLTQALWAVWPTRFPAPQAGGGGDAASSPLVAHAGVAGIATELAATLRPYLDQADDVGLPVCFAGHSLGGSIAMLSAALHRLRGGAR